MLHSVFFELRWKNGVSRRKKNADDDPHDMLFYVVRHPETKIAFQRLTHLERIIRNGVVLKKETEEFHCVDSMKCSMLKRERDTTLQLTQVDKPALDPVKCARRWQKGIFNPGSEIP